MKTEVWAVVPAKDVEISISNTLRQLNRAGITKTLVICNGCRDKTKMKVQETIPKLNMPVELLEYPIALGHDVPRAYGAIYAWRKRECSHLLFIDGDWNGSFGPMLESFINECLDRKLDIMWAHFAVSSDNSRAYLAPWCPANLQNLPELLHANPAIAPIMVSIATFSLLSPYWLHHPGKWFAYAIQLSPKGLRLGVNRLWDGRLTGHMLKDRKHDDKMKETLLGDAAEGNCILSARPLSRVFAGKVRIGFHHERRVDLLLKEFASIQLTDQNNS
jgi:hypothetical protein